MIAFRILAKLTILFLVVVSSLTPVFAAKRVALVIGNSAYEHAPVLNNPKNDATAISAVLEKLGFDVVTGIDLKHVEFAQTVGQFHKKLKGADVGLFFYAGHGLQVHGENYLAPLDAKLDNETSLDFEAVPLRLILKLMERSTKTNLVFLDACRDNPLARNLARSMGTRSTAIGRGLARVESGLGTLITFATQPGNVALDGEGKNSPFATGMLKHMETPGLDVELVMRRVREEVIAATSGSQVPWSNSSLTGSFIFNDKLKEKPKPMVTAPPEPRFDRSAIDLALWQSAKDTGTRQAYGVYLRKFPEGTFAPMAQMKLDAFTRSEEAQTKQQSELEAAKKKQAKADKAKREAEAKQLSAREATAKKQAAANAARLKAEAAQRQRELTELEEKQAVERARLARERDELAQRLKILEEAAKKRAEAEKQKKQRLAALQPPELQPQPDATATPLLDPHTMTLILQNELKRVGCDPGKVDGKWGRKGRNALTLFNRHAKLQLPTATPSMGALEAVKNANERVCPLQIVKPKAITKTTRKPQKPIKKTESKRNTLKGKKDAPIFSGASGRVGKGKMWGSMKEYCDVFPSSITCL